MCELSAMINYNSFIHTHAFTLYISMHAYIPHDDVYTSFKLSMNAHSHAVTIIMTFWLADSIQAQLYTVHILLISINANINSLTPTSRNLLLATAYF